MPPPNTGLLGVLSRTLLLLLLLLFACLLHCASGQLASDAFSGKLMDPGTISGGREDTKG